MSLLKFEIQDIMKMLPHRYPFLLLDKVYDVDGGKSGYGEKLYTINEYFFQGHFPENPIVPGVILIESLAQLTAVVYQASGFENCVANHNNGCNFEALKKHVGYLAKVNVKINKPVHPGDVVQMYVELKRKMGNLTLVSVTSKVRNNVVLSGELFVSESNGNGI